MSNRDKNGKTHGVETSTYYYSGGEEVEYDEEYDNFDIDDLDDEDVTEYSSYYWHGQSVSKEKYVQKVKQHGKWLKGMKDIDGPAFQTLLADPAFVIDFVGSMDLQEALVQSKGISAKDFVGIKSDNKGLSEAIKFLTPFKKDFEKGIVTTFYENGRVKERFQIKDDKKNGFYELYDEYDGKLSKKANYLDNRLEGLCEVYDCGRCIRRHHYKSGKLNGPFEEDCMHSGWGIVKGNYKDGVLDGEYERDNGADAYQKGVYHNGKFTGLLINHPLLDPITVEYYKDGKKDGPFKEYLYYRRQPDGTLTFDQMVASGTYKKGKLDGLYESWHSNGKLGEKCQFLNGVLNGLYEKWSREGQLLKKCRYVNGVLNGLCEEYYGDGSLKSKVMYKDGEIDKSKLARDKTSTLRRGFLAVLETVDKLPASKGRRVLKRAVRKGYRLITPKEKPKRSGR